MEFFKEEKNGKDSLMRGLVSLVVGVAMFVVIWHTIEGTEIDLGVIVCLLTIGFGGKFAQKYQEVKKSTQ